MALFEKDFIMRQVQYLTQLLQEIIFKKNQNQLQEAREDIHNALEKLTKDHPKHFSELDLTETINLFTRNDHFESELALAVADLLVEQGKMLKQEAVSKSQKCYAQALLLYKNSLRDDAAAMPLDIGTKINQLEKALQHTDWPDDINRILTS